MTEEKVLRLLLVNIKALNAFWRHSGWDITDPLGGISESLRTELEEYAKKIKWRWND